MTDSMLARARRAARVQFMALGVIAGTWGAHMPSLKDRYALSDAALSAVLLAAGIGTVAALFIAGRVVGRIGARRAATVAGLLMSLLLGIVLVLPAVAIVVPAVLILGAS